MTLGGLFRARYLIPLGTLIVLGSIGFALRNVLSALGVALTLAYMLNPSVNYLQALRLRRSTAAMLVLVTFLVLTLTAFITGLPGLLREVLDASAEASARLPERFEALKQQATALLGDRFHVHIPANLLDLGGKFGTEIRNLIPNPADLAGAFSQTMAIFAAAMSSLIVPIFAYYLLLDFNHILEALRKLIPRRIAPGTESLVKEIDVSLRRYLSLQAQKSAILALLFAIGFRIVGIRLAIPLGIMTGILAFVPYVGITVGTVLAILMALLDGSSTYLLGVGIVVSVVCVVNIWLITPGIIGDDAPLKPLELLLAMIGAVNVFGLVGLIFAVQMGVVLKILLRRINKVYLASDYYRHIPGLEPAPVIGEKPIAERVSIPPARPTEPPPAPLAPLAPPTFMNRVRTFFGAKN